MGLNGLRGVSFKALRIGGTDIEELPDDAIDTFTRDTLACLLISGLYAVVPSLDTRVEVYGHLRKIARRRKPTPIDLHKDLQDVCYLFLGKLPRESNSFLSAYLEQEGFLGVINNEPSTDLRFGRFGLSVIVSQSKPALTHYDRDFMRSSSSGELDEIPVVNAVGIAQSYPFASEFLDHLQAKSHTHSLYFPDLSLFLDSIESCSYARDNPVKPVHLIPLVAHYLKFLYDRFSRAGEKLPPHLIAV